MNVSASERSSGCESGWTLYLDQTSVSVNECHKAIEDEDEEEEEEDLSMVSDASSGPPHYNEDDEFENGYCFDSNFSGSELGEKGKRKKKMKEHGRNQQQQHPCLDDTASSPVLSFSKKNLGLSNSQDSVEGVMDFSQGFSATHKEKSAVKKHFGFLKSSFAEKPDSKQPGGFHGRK